MSALKNSYKTFHKEKVSNKLHQEGNYKVLILELNRY